MAVPFRLADIGEGITEAEIVEWLVSEGDTVTEHQLILRIETDKALVDVPAPASGRIGRLRHGEGDTVRVGEILLWILAEGESEPTVVEETANRNQSTTVVGALDQAAIELPPETATHQQSPESERPLLVTPAVRRLARELGVSIHEVRGTGNQGRITEADVREHAEGRTPDIAPTEAAETFGTIERIALRGVRRTIARRLKTAVTEAVLVTHMDEIDVTDLVAHEQAGGSIFAWIVRAVALALKQHRRFNARLDPEHEEILLAENVNIGIAVDTEEGLMVPIIRRADEKSIQQLRAEINALAEACRNRSVDISSLHGGTFSISNIGARGGLFATPIPNHPEVAILATGRIVEKLTRADDGSVASRAMLPVSLTFDHRMIDGADAARFVNTLRLFAAEPNRLDL